MIHAYWQKLGMHNIIIVVSISHQLLNLVRVQVRVRVT